MKKSRSLLVAFLMVTFLLQSIQGYAVDSSSASMNQEESTKVIKSVKVDNEEVRYLVRVSSQKGMNISKYSTEKLPLFVFLHGSGNHPDIDKYMKGEKAGFVNEVLNSTLKFNSIVVAPQMPVDDKNKYIRWGWSSWADHVMKAIDETIANYPVDTNRIYLMGFSMGGMGTIDLACKYPDKFAACIVGAGCATDYSSNLLKNLTYTPIWFFHGTQDDSVPYEYGKGTANELTRLKGNVTFTSYTGGHLLPAYAFGQSTFEWLLQQNLAENNRMKAETEKKIAEAIAAKASAPFGYATEGKPIVDGLAEDIWNNAVEYTTTKSIKGNNSASAKFKALWDSQYLYVLAKVNDPKISVTSSATHEQDSVEFYIDTLNAIDLRYHNQCAQYRVSAKNYKTASFGANIDQFITAVNEVEGGYLVEAAIPLKDQVTAGQIIGFDVAVNDDMGNGKREGIMTWSDKTGNAWFNPSMFGKIKLVNELSTSNQLIEKGVNEEKIQEALFLSVGSPNSYANGAKKPIDSTNTHTVPFVKDGTTFVPVRFISESFKALVKWNALTSSIEIESNGKKIIFKLGNKTYTVDGKELTLPVPVQEVNGRAFVPLRAFAEAVGANLIWDERGLIGISQNESTVDYISNPNVKDVMLTLLK